MLSKKKNTLVDVGVDGEGIFVVGEDYLHVKGVYENIILLDVHYYVK